MTNREKYFNRTSDELIEMLEDRLCPYCPLPDELKGVHCYGGQPVYCEGSHCQEALEHWLEIEYEDRDE
jgi:hypothetical protein